MEHLKLSHALGRKVLIYILLVSTILSIVATAIQLYSDYRYDVDELEREFIAIEASHLDSLALNLWDFQDKAIEQQLAGIQSLPFINYVHLTTPQGNSYSAGEQISSREKSQKFDVIYKGEKIGRLQVDANYQEIYDRLVQKAWVILLTQFVKTMIAALAITAIVYWFITRHIYKIEEYATGFTVDKIDKEFKLDGNRKHQDELDELVVALNNMRLLVKNEFKLRLETEQQLSEFNQHLERKIQLRTQELETSLTQLKETQATLVQSEKMVALGQLVAGIAHEINTPLGIGVTANSVMLDSVKGVSKQLAEGNLTKIQLEQFLQDQEETAVMLQRNLDRAVELIRSFKSVAVNQTSDNLHHCDIAQLITEVIATVQTMFKGKNYNIEVDIPDRFSLVTYPGAWTQILNNLLLNSHLHGFEFSQTGNVLIKIEQVSERFVMTYQDDGAGISEQIINNVFDPFVTTKRGHGGSGLGLNILFNLVFEKLNGKVKVENLAKGCRFSFDCPLEIRKYR